MSLALKLFALMFLQFFVLTVNTISIAHGNYLGTFVTDIVICLLNFTILKEMVESKQFKDRIGYALGGALGAQFAIFVASHFK